MPSVEMYPLLQPADADTGTVRMHATKITWAEGVGLCESGLAIHLIKRGKYAFKLTRATSPQAMDIRGPSCRMGPVVIEANAANELWAVLVTRAWQPCV